MSNCDDLFARARRRADTVLRSRAFVQTAGRTIGVVCSAVVLTMIGPAAASAESVPGIGVVREASAWIGDRANLPKYSYAILSSDELWYAHFIKAANPAEKVLLYKGALEIGDCGTMVAGCVGGVTLLEAEAHDAASPGDQWLLRDSAGHTISNPAYPGSYLANVGSASYQAQWVANAAGALRDGGFDGIFVDDVLAQVSGWSNGVFPTAYPTDAAWEAAMQRFIAAVGPALKAQGLYVLVNGYKGGSNDGSLDASWWRAIAPSVNGLMAEYWEQSTTDLSRVYDTDPCCWTGHWQSWLELANAAQENGVDFVPLQWGSGTDTSLMTYGKASFLLVWNGQGGAYIFNPTEEVDPWNDAWTTDIGRPVGDRYPVGVAWRRDYSGGTVLVNPDPSNPQTVNLNGSYQTSDGRTVTSLTLQPRTAAILAVAAAAAGSTPGSRPASSAPSNTALPVISGTPQPGQNLYTTNGSWSGTPTSFAYQWLRCDSAGANCVPIWGETFYGITLSADDAHHTIRVTVTATNDSGSSSATSN